MAERVRSGHPGRQGIADALPHAAPARRVGGNVGGRAGGLRRHGLPDGGKQLTAAGMIRGEAARRKLEGNLVQGRTFRAPGGSRLRLPVAAVSVRWQDRRSLAVRRIGPARAEATFGLAEIAGNSGRMRRLAVMQQRAWPELRQTAGIFGRWPAAKMRSSVGTGQIIRPDRRKQRVPKFPTGRRSVPRFELSGPVDRCRPAAARRIRCSAGLRGGDPSGGWYRSSAGRVLRAPVRGPAAGWNVRSLFTGGGCGPDGARHRQAPGPA